MIVKCKCGKATCLKCRYPGTHDCKIDRKEEYKDFLIRNNPIIVDDKIENRL